MNTVTKTKLEAGPRKAQAAPLEKKRRATGGWTPRVEGGSREARKRAAVILDVLAGVSTPSDAAGALSVSLTRYYALEAKLLGALVLALEPGADDKRRKPEKKLEELARENERLKRECARKQSLVRALERTMGLAFPEATKPGKPKRKRRPTVRALRVSALLRAEPASEPLAPAGEPAGVS